MNNTLFISNASNAVVSLFKRIRAGVWARITWKAHCHVPDLIKDLKDEQGEVRYLAAWTLSKMGSEAKIAVPALIEALKDEEGEVRCLAAKILSRMGDEIEIPISTLIEALGDNEKYVYRFALRTLEKKQIDINVDCILAKLSKSTICRS